MIIENIARQQKTCVGCGRDKSVGLVVCWDCFKYRKDVTPLKYYEKSFREWIAEELHKDGDNHATYWNGE